MIIFPTCSVPVRTIILAITHCLASLYESKTTQTALRFGLYLSSSISACNNIFSNNLSIHSPVFEETPITGTSPPHSSGVSHWAAISAIIWSLLCPGLSIFVIAIMIGTQAAFAWLIDSIVWGITESSAATTITAIFVSLAHLALSDVNNSCPGVSMKVIFFPL